MSLQRKSSLSEKNSNMVIRDLALGPDHPQSHVNDIRHAQLVSLQNSNHALMKSGNLTYKKEN